MKRLTTAILVIAIIATLFVGTTFASEIFTDVPADHPYYDVIRLFVEVEILNGYPNGEFRPGNSITRAKFAAVICRAYGAEEEAKSLDGTIIFTDIPAEYWASGYIAYIYNAGAINGMGDGTFAPESDITFEQAIKVVIAARGYGLSADSLGGYPYGYLEIGKELGVTNNVDVQVGQPVNRGEVVQIIFNGFMLRETSSTMGYVPQRIGSIAIGDSIDDADTDRTAYRIIDTDGGQWKFYNAYENFMMIYFSDGVVQYIYTTDVSDIGSGSVYMDRNDGDHAYAVSVGAIPKDTPETTEQLMFEITNAFRAVHGIVPLKWNETLGKAARDHCEDMAVRDFFDHTNPDGKGPGDRITALGYSWSACAENIDSGYRDAPSAIGGWISSSGHRKNLLTTACDEIGIGWVEGVSNYGAQVFGKQW